MSAHTVTVPEIADTARRVARTAVQVGIPSFLALAGAVPVVLQDAAQIDLSPTVRVALVGAAGLITGAAATLTRIMAIPAVNELLERVRLGGQSTVAGPLDTETRMLSLAAVSDAAH